MAKIILFFRGAVAMHFKYLDNFIRVINVLNYSPHVIFHQTSKPSAQVLAELDSHEFLDLGNVAQVRARVRKLCEESAIARIFVFHDEDVYTACLCREDNGISGLQPEHGIHFRDKNVMQQRARELGLATPRCCLPHTEKLLKDFITEVGYPVIIKPYNGFGCGNTYKVENHAQLNDIWKRIRNQRHDYRVEEFIRGKQFFIDSLVQNGEIVFDNLSQYTYNIIDYKQPDQYQGVITLAQGETPAHIELLKQCRKLLGGFGLSTGVAHTEFYLTEQGEIYFGETAARCGGGPIISLIQYAYGFDLVEQWIRLDLNAEHRINKQCQGAFGAEYLSTKAIGKIRHVSSSEKIRSLPTVVEADVWAQEGDILKEAEHCYEVLGYYICRGDNFAAVASQFRDIRENFHVEVG